jgi:cytochrome c553
MIEGRLMGRARRGLVGVALIGGVLLAAGCGSSSNNADLAKGKQQFTNLCGGCHMLQDAGTKGVTGPNLDGFHPSGMQQRVEQWMKLAQPPMPRELATGQDATNIAAYVASVAGASGQSVPRPIPTPDPQARPVKYRISR